MLDLRPIILASALLPIACHHAGPSKVPTPENGDGSVDNRAILINSNSRSIVVDKRSDPLVLALNPESCGGGDCYFELIDTDGNVLLDRVNEVVLEVDIDDPNPSNPVLDLVRPTPDYDYRFVYVSGVPIQIGHSLIPPQTDRFTFPVPTQYSYSTYRLNIQSPPYRLKVTVRRKS